MSTAYINTDVLIWARNRAGLSEDDLVQSINKKYIEWEEGLTKPTFKQAQAIAKKLRIPFGYLYLSKPPAESKLTVDLRTFGDSISREFSIDLKDVIADAIRKQDWYREYIKEVTDEPLEFVGKFNSSSKIKDVAVDISKTLKLHLDDRNQFSKDEFLRYLTEHAEEAGILVIRNGKVGSNTHRTLNVDEFRGFALTDPYAPLIFINSADFTAAQIFTFVHELAHIWIGYDGVSNYSINDDFLHSDTESLCNQIAAEVLVPDEDFKREWQHISGDVQVRSENLTRIFKVSSVVIARRALDLGYIQKEEFFNYYGILQKLWSKSKSKSSSGNFHNSFPIANSKSFTNAVCKEIFSGNLLMRNGARMLGVKPETIVKYAKQGGLI